MKISKKIILCSILIVVLTIASVVGFYAYDNRHEIFAWINSLPTRAEMENDVLNKRLSSISEELKSLTAERNRIQNELDELRATGREEDLARIAELESEIQSLNSQISEKDNKISRLTGIINGTVTEILAEDLEGITTISKYMFRDYDNLVSVVLPDTIIKIGAYAFEDCDRLKSIVFSNTLTELGEQAFGNLASLESINLPDSLTSIGAQCFRYCNKLTEVVIPDSVVTLSANCFYSCNNLKTVTIGSSFNGRETSIFSMVVPNCLKIRSLAMYNSANFSKYYPIAYIHAGSKILIEESIDDGSNTYLEENFTKSGVEDGYNVYIKN